MRMQITLAAVVAALLAGWMAGGAIDAEAQAEPPPAPPTSQPCMSGRFEYSSDAGGWLIDTHTGDTWTWDCPPNERRKSVATGLTLCNTDYVWIFRGPK